MGEKNKKFESFEKRAKKEIEYREMGRQNKWYNYIRKRKVWGNRSIWRWKVFPELEYKVGKRQIRKLLKL